MEIENAATSPKEPGSSFTSSSPLGNLSDSATRKLLIDLILTLNNSFADYDFRFIVQNFSVRTFFTFDMQWGKSRRLLSRVHNPHGLVNSEHQTCPGSKISSCLSLNSASSFESLIFHPPSRWIKQCFVQVDEMYNDGFCGHLWSAIEDVIKPAECEIYSYVPDLDDNCFSMGKM